MKGDIIITDRWHKSFRNTSIYLKLSFCPEGGTEEGSCSVQNGKGHPPVSMIVLGILKETAPQMRIYCL